MSLRLYVYLRFFGLQVKPTMALLSVVMFSVGKYHSLEYQIPYMVLYNFSICGALYALGLFYLATRKLPALVSLFRLCRCCTHFLFYKTTRIGGGWKDGIT